MLTFLGGLLVGAALMFAWLYRSIINLSTRNALEREAKASIGWVIATSPRDWSLCSSDAWIYHIALGWDAAFDEIASRHKWDYKTRQRAKSLHKAYQEV